MSRKVSLDNRFHITRQSLIGLNKRKCHVCGTSLTKDNVSVSRLGSGNFQCKSCVNKEGRDKRIRWKREVLGFYSGGTLECNSCGVDDLRTLSIDHINDGGEAHRRVIGSGTAQYLWLKRAGFPSGFQVLCMNCQFIKKHIANSKCHRPRSMDNKRTHRYKKRLKSLVLVNYSKADHPECVICMLGDERCLSIDHIGGGGRKHRKIIGFSMIYNFLKTNNFPDGYRTLCMNCQFISMHSQRQNTTNVVKSIE